MGQSLPSLVEPLALWVSSVGAHSFDTDGGLAEVSLAHRSGEGKSCIHSPSFRDALDSEGGPR